MSSTLDADIKIVMTAEDRASETVKDATGRINREFRDMNNQQKAIGRGFALQNQSLFRAGQVIRNVGSVAHTATSIYQRYNIMQLRVEESARDLARAQDKVREALRSSGAGSEEYRRALEAESEALAKNKQLQQENIINNIALATSATTAIQPLSRLANQLGATPSLASAAALGGTTVAATAGFAAIPVGVAFADAAITEAALGKEGAANVAARGRRMQQSRTGLLGLKDPSQSRKRAENVTINVHSYDTGLSAEEVYSALDVYG